MSAAPFATVSFVVINKDDRGLKDTLAALLGESSEFADATEVVVVDASSGRLDDLRDEFPAARWFPFEPKPGKPTIPEQRNVGIAQSRGDVVVFIDASCVPEPHWLDRLLEPMARHGEKVVAGTHRSASDSSFRDEAAHFHGSAEYVSEAPTMNLAVAREVFDRVGVFDEDFHYGSDVDFTWRARAAGYQIRLVRDAVVRHDWGGAKSEVRRSFLYGQARFRLYAKHPEHLKGALTSDPAAIVYPIVVLLAPLALIRPRLLAILAIPFVKNIRHRPVLTLVDHFVYAAGVLTAASARIRAAAAPRDS